MLAVKKLLSSRQEELGREYESQWFQLGSCFQNVLWKEHLFRPNMGTPEAPWLQQCHGLKSLDQSSSVERGLCAKQSFMAMPIETGLSHQERMTNYITIDKLT